MRISRVSCIVMSAPLENQPTLRRNGFFRTPEEKWLADCIKPRAKANEVGLIVWRCFWYDRWGPLVPILESKVDPWVFIALMDRHLPPVMQQIADEVGDICKNLRCIACVNLAS